MNIKARFFFLDVCENQLGQTLHVVRERCNLKYKMKSANSLFKLKLSTNDDTKLSLYCLGQEARGVKNTL